MRALVEEYRADRDFDHPVPAPTQAGITFVDFRSRTIFDAQTASYFPGFTKDRAIDALFNHPGVFAAYAPHFKEILRYAPLQKGEFRMPDLIATRFPKSADAKAMWKAAGAGTQRGALSQWENGRTVVLAKAVVPSDDFAALLLESPGWRVVSSSITDQGAMNALKKEFDDVVALSETDIVAWNRYIESHAVRG